MRFAWLFIVGCHSSTTIMECPDASVEPPGAPTTITSSTETITYALDAIWWGDTTRSSPATSTTAWKAFGFNLDGKQSDNKSLDVCTRQSGSPSSVQADGTPVSYGCGSGFGIDNSFGANIVPIFQSFDNDPTPSRTFTQLIQRGAFTLQLQVIGLDLAAVAQTAAGLTAQSFAANAFDMIRMPGFAPTEDWPVRGDLHPDPKVGSRFGRAYINQGVFVGLDGDVVLSLVQAPGRRLDLHIHHAIVTMTIRGDSADLGTLAGVLDTEEFVAAAAPFARAISATVCGSAWDGIAQQMRQTSDILDDGTNTTGKTCNGISLGIGFTAKRIANPARTGAPEPQIQKCGSSDGGAE